MSDSTNTAKATKSGNSELKYIYLPIISILTFLFIWQVLVYVGVISSSKLPLPSNVIKLFFIKLTNVAPDGATIQTNIMVSLKVALTGLSVAIIIGIPLGLLMGWYTSVDRFIRPIFEIIRPIPPIAWIPLTIIWVGVGLGAKAMIIFFAAFVPCVINSYTGIRQTSTTLINVAKTFGATSFQAFYKVGIPSAMPMVFAGIRIALGSSWATLVAAELLAANAGLGYMIALGRQFGRVDVVVLGMVSIGVLGFLFTYIFSKIENMAVKWRTV